MDTPTDGSSFHTTAGEITLGGGAFVRSENGGPVADVTWSNQATGESGPAVSRFTYEWVCFLWTCAWGETGHVWSATIRLEPGANPIVVEARTNEFNWARLRVTVTRDPDSTPPAVGISDPSGDPAFTVDATTVTLGGWASDEGGLATLTVVNETTGASAPVIGLALWSATVELQPGVNRITVTATDSAGLSASAVVEVTRSA